MPSYVFTGTERTYPETRDASGTHLGTVTPGDIRIFDDPPADGMWVPEIPPRRDGDSGGEDEGAGQAGAPGDTSGSGEDSAQPPPEPEPAAVIPGD